MGSKWRYGLIKDDHLIGAIKSIPQNGDIFSYGNCDGKMITLKLSVEDVYFKTSNYGEITLNNGETYCFYSI